MDKNELYHHGVLGMKWGVRRYQNKDGSLTSAGKRRRDTMISASEKAKRFSNKANADANRYSEKANRSKNSELTDSQYRKAMSDLFGHDSKNKKYVEEQAKSYGYKDSHSMAREHLGIGKEGYDFNKAFSDRAKRAAQYYSTLSETYKNADISSLNRRQIKKAEKFVKNAYLENLRYSDYSLKYDSKRYGL